MTFGRIKVYCNLKVQKLQTNKSVLNHIQTEYAEITENVKTKTASVFDNITIDNASIKDSLSFIQK